MKSCRRSSRIYKALIITLLFGNFCIHHESHEREKASISSLWYPFEFEEIGSPPCRIAVVNPEKWHFEVLESIAIQYPIPWDRLNCSARSKPVAFDFGFHFDAFYDKFKRNQEDSWLLYFRQYLQGHVHHRPSDGVRVRFGEILSVPHRSNPEELTSRYDAVVNATCEVPDMHAGKILTKPNQFCLVHEACPNCTERQVEQSCWVNPAMQPKSFFLPTTLPDLERCRIDPHVVRVCVVGQNRDYTPLISALKTVIPVDIEIAIPLVGHLDFPSGFDGFNVSFVRESGYLDFQRLIASCDVLLPMLDPANRLTREEYFGGKNRLSGSVTQAISYGIPVVVHEDLKQIYEGFWTAQVWTHDSTQHSFTVAFDQVVSAARKATRRNCDETSKDGKYKTNIVRSDWAAICTMAKDEQEYVEEWLDYHLSIGFGHIYIYDDHRNNTLAAYDGYHLPTETGTTNSSVTILQGLYDWDKPVSKWATRVGEKQVEIYSTCSKMLKNLTNPPKWVMIADIDEFLVFKNGVYNDVKTFLEKELPSGSMRLPWLNFGTSSQTAYKKEPVTRRFTYSVVEQQTESKYIAVLDHVEKFENHFAKVKMGYDDRLMGESAKSTYEFNGNFSVVALHHYRFKSHQEYLYRRCDAGNDETPYWYDCREKPSLPAGTVYDNDAWRTLKANLPSKYSDQHFSTPQPRPPEPKILIAVSTSRSKPQRVRTILKTWARTLPPQVIVRFFVGEAPAVGVASERGNETQLSSRVGLYRSNERFHVMVGTEDDEYPPNLRHTKMLQDAVAIVDSYPTIDFIFKVDDDTYVHIPNLLDFLKDKDPSQPHYWGEPAFGSPDDMLYIKDAGLLKPYCNGGPGYILSKSSLAIAAEKMPIYNEMGSASPHRSHIFWDDVLLGLCMQQEVGIGCGNDDVEYNRISTMSLPFRNDWRPRDEVTDWTSFLDIISMHPLKEAKQMISLHKIVTLNLKPQEYLFDNLVAKSWLQVTEQGVKPRKNRCSKCLSEIPGSSCSQCTTCKHFCRAACESHKQLAEKRKQEETILIDVNPEIKRSGRFIPRIVHQTWFEDVDRRRDPNRYERMESFRNSSWEYNFYTDKDIRELISLHLSEHVLEAFDALIPGPLKADLFRYCVLFIRGGLYADTDILLQSSLDEAIPNDVAFLVPIDGVGAASGRRSCLWNGLMAAAPGHPILKAAIEITVNQIRKRATTFDMELDYCHGKTDISLIHKWAPLFLSGPCALGNALNRVLGRFPQAPFREGDVEIPETSVAAQFAKSVVDHANMRTVLLQKDTLRSGTVRFVLLEKNLSIAATDFGGWAKDKESMNEAGRLHYMDTPGATGKKEVWGLLKVYRDRDRKNSTITLRIKNHATA